MNQECSRCTNKSCWDMTEWDKRMKGEAESHAGGQRGKNKGGKEERGKKVGARQKGRGEGSERRGETGVRICVNSKALIRSNTATPSPQPDQGLHFSGRRDQGKIRTANADEMPLQM